MTGKLNGYAPTLATVVTIAVVVIGVAVSWGSNANRLDEHDRRLDTIEELVRSMQEDVTNTRADVRWLRRKEEAK